MIRDDAASAPIPAPPPRHDRRGLRAQRARGTHERPRRPCAAQHGEQRQRERDADGGERRRASTIASEATAPCVERHARPRAAARRAAPRRSRRGRAPGQRHRRARALSAAHAATTTAGAAGRPKASRKQRRRADRRSVRATDLPRQDLARAAARACAGTARPRPDLARQRAARGPRAEGERARWRAARPPRRPSTSGEGPWSVCRRRATTATTIEHGAEGALERAPRRTSVPARAGHVAPWSSRLASVAAHRVAAARREQRR